MEGKLKTFRTQSLFNFGFHVDLALCFERYQEKFTVFKDRNVLARVAFLTPVRELGCKRLKATATFTHAQTFNHCVTLCSYGETNETGNRHGKVCERMQERSKQ